MTLTEQDITGELVLEDRRARKLSRTAYGRLLGLSPTKVRNIEQGRELRAEERAALLTLLNGGAPDATVAGGTTGAGEVATPQTEPAPVVTIDELEWEQLELDYADAQPELEAAYANDGLDPRVAELDARVLPDEAPPERFEVPVLNLSQFYDGTDDGVKRISNGELRTYQRCKRRWWLSHYRRLGLRYEEPVGARSLGTRVHAALAGYYTPGAQWDPLTIHDTLILEDRERVAEVYADQPDRVTQVLRDLESDADLGRAMLEGYLEWVQETGADEGLEVVAPETILDVDLRAPQLERPTRLIAKMDVRLVRKLDGARLFMDHKTVGNLVQPTRLLPLEPQMLHYHLAEYLDLLDHGLDAEGVRTDGALYNMLRKVKRTAQAKPPFYQRVEVRHNVHELRSYWSRVVGTVREILQLTAALDAGASHQEVAPPNPMGNRCEWDCDFFAICPMFDDGSRVEDFVREHLVEVNPLRRYEAPGE